MRVAIVAPGEMGAAIGGRLRRHGVEVVTSLAGRSRASAARAEAAGLIAAAGDDDLLASTDILLSVVPPAQAVPLAERLAPALARTNGCVTYADCNAISPETTKAVAAHVAVTGCPFVDAGIIGAPPRNDEPGPRIYISGDAAPRLQPLAACGLDIRPIEGGIGVASALKLAYASLTKGLTALGAVVALAAAAGDTGETLLAELAASQPQLLAWLTRQVPGMYPKAYRWVAEMEEIGRFLTAAGHPDAGAMFTNGAAPLYTRIAQDSAGGRTGEIALLDQLYAPTGKS
jgi:3-hydroxyisobutyrate dehydrogenase-like beta-hydroxyacid dehydrogenase